MIFNFFFLLGVKVRAGNESSRAEPSRALNILR